MIELEYISTLFQGWEGRKLKAYIPCYVLEHAQARVGCKTRNYTGDNGNPEDYMVMGRSGVTIATGCDLGQQTAAGLRAMGISASLVEHFAPYLERSCDMAIAALHRCPCSITDAECDALDLAVHSDYVRRCALLYDSASSVPFAAIPREAQAVVAHLFYHLGGPQKYPQTWRALIRQEWRVAAAKLCDGALWSGPYDAGRASEGRLLQKIFGGRHES